MNMLYFESEKHEKELDADDIVFEEGSLDSEQNSFENDELCKSCKAKLAKLRKKLKECEKEKQDYLLGWQRQRADAANEKKRFNNELQKVKERAVSDALVKILPALDSFDMALADKNFDNLDSKWKDGINYIHKQIKDALLGIGLESFANEGEDFDHNIHNAVSREKTKQKELDQKIAKVLTKGYKINNIIIRPAQVVVYSFED